MLDCYSSSSAPAPPTPFAYSSAGGVIVTSTYKDQVQSTGHLLILIKRASVEKARLIFTGKY